jgi:hypothetical protein
MVEFFVGTHRRNMFFSTYLPSCLVHAVGNLHSFTSGANFVDPTLRSPRSVVFRRFRYILSSAWIDVASTQFVCPFPPSVLLDVVHMI